MKINFFNETDQKIWKYEKVIKKVFKTIDSKKTFNFKVGDTEFAAYDVWELGNSQEFTVGGKYTLTGFGALYVKGDVKTPQLYFKSATAEGTGIEAVKANAQFEGKMYNLAGQVVNMAYKGMVVMNGRKFVNK